MVSVSYTHLDVYKRQSENGAMLIKSGTEILSVLTRKPTRAGRSKAARKAANSAAGSNALMRAKNSAGGSVDGLDFIVTI